MNNIKLNLDQLAELTGKDKSTLESTLFEINNDGKVAKENASSLVLNLVKEEVKRIDEAAQGKGKRDRMVAFENAVKEKYGFTSNTQGEALIDKIIESQVNASKASSNKSPKSKEEIESYVKNTDFFKNVVSDFNNKISVAEKALEDNKKAISENQKKSLFNSIVGKKLDSMNPIFPKGKGDVWINLFQEDLFKKTNSKVEGKEIILLDSQGNPLQDDRYQAVTLNDLVEEEGSNWFEFQNHDPKEQTPLGKEHKTSGFDYAKANQIEISKHLTKIARDNPELFEKERAKAKEYL